MSVTLGVFLEGACDTPPPAYGTRSAYLRLVPEVSEVDSSGGSVFVLAEVRRPSSDKGTAPPFLLYLDVEGGTLESLPGPIFCTQANGGTNDAGTADAGGGADAGDGGEVPKESSPVQSKLVIPGIAFVCRDTEEPTSSGSSSISTAEQICETGFLVHVPEGEQDTLVTAAAYVHEEASESCTPKSQATVGFAVLRIERASAEADAGQNDADGKNDADGGTEEDAGTSDANDEDDGGGTTDAASDAG